MAGSNYKHVFSPVTIRGVEFKNRIELAPPSPNLAGADGHFTTPLIDWMRMFARGGVCTLYLGNCSIDINESKDEAYQLNLNSDEFILDLARYADMCKEYDCHGSLEINHNGENTRFETVGHPSFSASSRISASEESWAKMMGRDPIPCIEMTKDKIEETVNKFGDAAARMKRAGMDIVLVHGGHGNLISQFTSPLYNFRTDEYGGSLENRARFAIEVCQNIREKAGEDFVIEYRISADEIAPGGMHFPETLELISLLEPYIDIVHVSAGLHSDFNMAYYRNWCQNFLMDRGFNVHYAADVKKAFPNLYVTTVGSITSIEMAEEIIASGQADFIAMSRALQADPDMPNKYARNQPESRRPCLRCDTCTKHLMIPKPAFCAVNPMSGMTSVLPDGVVPKAEIKKKCAVVGGGPGGIQALVTLCERGHDVTLYEASAHLGGNVRGAAAPPFKIDAQDYLKFIRWEAKNCQDKYGAKVLLNTPATKELLELEGYDAIILANGADPIMPKSIPGIDKPHVAWAPEAEYGEFETGDNIVIVGAGSVGLEAAIDFVDQGKKVTVIEMLDEQGAYNKMFETAHSSTIEMKDRILPEKGIEPMFCHALAEICDDKVIAKNMETGEMVEIPCDTVLLAMGLKPRKAAADEMRHSAPESDVFLIGDVRKVGTIYEAVNQAFKVCLHI